MMIDPALFAKQCLSKAISFEVLAHYMVAVAKLRSKISDDPQGNMAGPFQLTQAEWDQNRQDTNFAVDYDSEDIKNWRAQCTVFALMTRRNQDKQRQVLSRPANPVELYLAQWPQTDPATLSPGLQHAFDDTAEVITQAAESFPVDPGPAAEVITDPAQKLQAGATAGNLDDKVQIPPRSQLNPGLSACKESTMLAKFGKPGALTTDCSDPTGPIKTHIKDLNFGSIRKSGLDFAVDLLQAIFTDLQRDDAALFDRVKAQIKSDGMLCVRGRRTAPSVYSNHSWGTAIDIYFGSAVVEQGSLTTHRGNLILAPYFNRRGWYWGAGFSGDAVDSMHFELAEETIATIPFAVA
jgi:hypothetical protein